MDKTGDKSPCHQTWLGSPKMEVLGPRGSTQMGDLTTSLFSRILESWFLGKSSQKDPTIQVSELWSFAQIFEDVFERISRTNSLRTPFIFADMDPKMRVDPFDVDICAVKNGKARSADCGVQLRFELFIAESDPHKLGSPCNFGESHPSQTPTAPFK